MVVGPKGRRSAERGDADMDRQLRQAAAHRQSVDGDHRPRELDSEGKFDQLPPELQAAYRAFEKWLSQHPDVAGSLDFIPTLRSDRRALTELIRDLCNNEIAPELSTGLCVCLLLEHGVNTQILAQVDQTWARILNQLPPPAQTKYLAVCGNILLGLWT